MNGKTVEVLTACILGVMILVGCADSQRESEEEKNVIGVYEAEDAQLSPNLSVKKEMSGFSGTGYAEGFEAEGDECTFRITVEETGFYDFQFTIANIGGYKENFVLLDGVSAGTIASPEGFFTEERMKRNYLEAGEHEITVSKYWGYIALDKLTVLQSKELEEDYYQVSAKLCNENADDCAKRLMSYLVDNYGTNIISGQYCDGGLYGHEMACIWKETGEFPAMVGLDMIEYSPSRTAHGSEEKSITYAMQAWEGGAIVTICWHWNAPEQYLTGNWYSGFYTDSTNIDLDKIMNGEDEEGYQALISDMDVIAKELQKLQRAGVPVLFRPLHEASGGWFWWGDCTPDSYIKSWYETYYDRQERSEKILAAVWSQIAERFQDYDEHLIFEGLNEPRKKGTDVEWNGGDQEGWDVVNALNAVFVRTIRESGGNNPDRILMIPGYAANAWAALEHIQVPEDDKIIVSVHAYEPYDFALNVQGRGTWDQDTENIDTIMQKLDELFISKGIPVIIGEFGAMYKNTEGNESERAAWVQYYVSRAAEKGIPCIWWDNGAFEGNGELFGLINRETCEWKYPLILEGLKKGTEQED